MLLNDLYEEYVLFARAANRSRNTIVSMQYHVRRFTLFLDERRYGKDCEAMTPRVVREFISTAQESYAEKTVANNVRALKTLFAFGVREELIAIDPTRRIAVPSVTQTDKDILNPEDVDCLLRACDTNALTGVRDFAIVMLLFDSGVRASELVGLNDSGVDWERGLIQVLGKGAKERQVPISGRTLRALRRYQNKRNRAGFGGTGHLFVNNAGERLTSSGLLQMLERLGKRAGIHVHPHMLRHSFAVNALRNEAPLAAIQDTLGHTTLHMTRHYARQSAVDLAKHHKRYSPADTLKTRV